jgi:hypothetical protein
MSPPSHDELKKQIHRDENQIDAIANKIDNLSDFGTTSQSTPLVRSKKLTAKTY